MSKFRQNDIIAGSWLNNIGGGKNCENKIWFYKKRGSVLQETDRLTLRVIVRLENVGFTVQCLKVCQIKRLKIESLDHISEILSLGL